MRLRRWIAFMCAVALWLIPAALAPASAQTIPESTLAWSSCGWLWRTNSTQLRYRIVGTWPAGKIAEGASWSFHDRIRDGAKAWDNQVRQLSPAYTIPEASSTQTAQISLVYQQYSNAAYGYAERTMRSGGCAIRSSPGSGQIEHARIYVTPRSDWFTAWNETRPYWENNCPGGLSYTCSKLVDFGGTVTHEFGHTLGLRHPQDVSATAATTAKCRTHVDAATAKDQATLCMSTDDIQRDRYRSERRTLNGYDLATLRRHWELHR